MTPTHVCIFATYLVYYDQFKKCMLEIAQKIGGIKIYKYYYVFLFHFDYKMNI